MQILSKIVFLSLICTSLTGLAKDNKALGKLDGLTSEPVAQKKIPTPLTADKFTKKKTFEYAATALKEKLKNSKSGGVIDGGGGNSASVGAQGMLLDSAKKVGTVPLDKALITADIEHAYGSRLDDIESELPGFRQWLFQGLEIHWLTDEKPVNPEVCANYNPYKMQTEITVCQTLTQAIVKRSWFDQVQPTQGQEPADTFLHELIRYYGIRVAIVEKLTQEQQDTMVADITSLILDRSASPNSLYTALVDNKILLDELTVKTTITLEATGILNQMAQLKANTISMRAICQTPAISDPDLKNSVKTNIAAMKALLLTLQGYCTEISNTILPGNLKYCATGFNEIAEAEQQCGFTPSSPEPK